jgi:hypothetical protein
MLQHLILERDQPQFFRPADKVRAISNYIELKVVMLRKIGDGLSEGCKTGRLEPAVGVCEDQY